MTESEMKKLTGAIREDSEKLKEISEQNLKNFREQWVECGTLELLR